MIANERVISAARLIARVYEHNNVGGNLHVQLDDWNIEDEFFEDELDQSFWAEPLTSHAAETACFGALKVMSLHERAAALALTEEFWTAAS